MVANIEVRQVTTRKERLAFVKLPWQVYKGDPNWVPPLISDQLDYLDPQKNNYFSLSHRYMCPLHKYPYALYEPRHGNGAGDEDEDA